MTHQPNILFLFTDQLRYDALGCNGAPICRTPAIDSLAEQGMNFSNAFTPIALCTPARASLLSGLYPHNHGQLANLGNFNGVFDEQILKHETFVSALKDAGYQTGYVGKWHLPEEENREVWGIDNWHSYREWEQSLKDGGYEDYDFARDEVQRLEWGHNAPFAGLNTLSAEKMREAWGADRTIDLIQRYSESDQPFMLMSSFFGPHFPYSVPAPYHEMYDPEIVEKWGNFDEMFIDKPLIQEKELLRWNAGHRTWRDWQKIIAIYWGYCTYIDDQIGRILTALDETRQAENTLIIFSADHGDMLGSHRLFNKGFHMYEETHHIPFIAKWSGMIKWGTTCDSFVNLVDVAPTLLECADSEPLDAVDGRSLLPLIRGEQVDDWRDDVYAEFHGYESTLCSVRMIRTHAWKYVYNPTSIDELYDLESDPHELHNLAGKLGFKHVLRHMKARLVRQLQATGDDIIEDDSWKGSSYDLYLSRREQ